MFIQVQSYSVFKESGLILIYFTEIKKRLFNQFSRCLIKSQQGRFKSTFTFFSLSPKNLLLKIFKTIRNSRFLSKNIFSSNLYSVLGSIYQLSTKTNLSFKKLKFSKIFKRLVAQDLSQKIRFFQSVCFVLILQMLKNFILFLNEGQRVGIIRLRPQGAYALYVVLGGVYLFFIK